MIDLPHSPASLTAADRVVLFPTVGHLEPEGRLWRVHVHGDVFAPGRIGLTKRVLLRWLQRTMRAPDWAIAEPLFQHRIQRFIADDKRGKRVAVQIAGRTFVLPRKTDRHGHFSGVVRLSNYEVERAANHQGQLPIEVELGDGESTAEGQAHLLPPEGVSVVSDIDDTIKHSGVGCRRTLLVNTFLREFEPIPGIVPLFQQWASEGASFHYVSSSPWQLYTHLADHFGDIGLPAGSFHLRAFRLRDQLLRRLLWMRRSGKAAALASLIKSSPRRRFILVGDSGEIDPEIYGSLARRYPRQVARILIRAIEGPKCVDKRFRKAFRQIDRSRWQIFHQVEDLAPELAELAGA
jgi:phosphatidate phosphatase APP1